jgi:hypothetical protein
MRGSVERAYAPISVGSERGNGCEGEMLQRILIYLRYQAFFFPPFIGGFPSLLFTCSSRTESILVHTCVVDFHDCLLAWGEVCQSMEEESEPHHWLARAPQAGFQRLPSGSSSNFIGGRKGESRVKSYLLSL